MGYAPIVLLVNAPRVEDCVRTVWQARGVRVVMQRAPIVLLGQLRQWHRFLQRRVPIVPLVSRHQLGVLAPTVLQAKRQWPEVFVQLVQLEATTPRREPPHVRFVEPTLFSQPLEVALQEIVLLAHPQPLPLQVLLFAPTVLRVNGVTWVYAQTAPLVRLQRLQAYQVVRSALLEHTAELQLALARLVLLERVLLRDLMRLLIA